MRRRSLALLSAIALLSLTACGEQRSVQCQKVGDVLNAASSQRMSASSATDSFSKGAEISRKAAADLQALELGDKKLSNLRSHLAASFQDMADSSTAIAAVAGPDGSVISDSSTSAEHDALFTKFAAVGTDFNTKFTALQTYCNGGTVPSELTDAPAQ